jgi:hypothetical protein
MCDASIPVKGVSRTPKRSVHIPTWSPVYSWHHGQGTGGVGAFRIRCVGCSKSGCLVRATGDGITLLSLLIVEENQINRVYAVITAQLSRIEWQHYSIIIDFS